MNGQEGIQKTIVGARNALNQKTRGVSLPPATSMTSTRWRPARYQHADPRQLQYALCFDTSRASGWVALDDSAEDVSPEFLRALGPGGPAMEMPQVGQDEGQDTERVARLLELASEGLSDTAIARKVLGYANSRTIEEVRQVRRQRHR
jgi:hypothetical protein